jgi:hypothetical protein
MNYKGYKEIIEWDVEHASLLGLLWIISFIFFIISMFLFYTDLNRFFKATMLISSMLVTTLLWPKYNNARKFHNLIKVFDKGSLKWGVINGYQLKFISEDFGEFYMSYLPEGSKLAFYKLGIISDSCDQYIDENRKVLWKRPTIMERILAFEPPEVTEDIPLRSIEKVKALRNITLEKHEYGNWIVAQLDDDYLRSETLDLIRALKILRKIDDNFKTGSVFEFTIPSCEETGEFF